MNPEDKVRFPQMGQLPMASISNYTVRCNSKVEHGDIVGNESGKMCWANVTVGRMTDSNGFICEGVVCYKPKDGYVWKGQEWEPEVVPQKREPWLASSAARSIALFCLGGTIGSIVRGYVTGDYTTNAHLALMVTVTFAVGVLVAKGYEWTTKKPKGR